MKRKTNFARITRTVWWLGLIVCVGLTAARAQVADGTVIPRVCYEAKPETFTRTLGFNHPVGSPSFSFSQTVPQGFYRVVVNPGGTTQESFLYGMTIGNGNIRINISGLPGQTFANAHAMGETILLTADGEALFGYNNTSAAVVTIPRNTSSVSSNAFGFGSNTYTLFTGQPNDFQPGVQENVVRVKVLSDLRSISGLTVPTWHLNGSQATSTGNASQGCATITYQGRLSDAGSAANGQFDLQFQAFEAETGGIAQSLVITLDNVQVTNGIFTVPLYFGATLTDNYKAQFLEIGVRPGTSTGAFTVLTPRQPITSVPYAINAQNAATATNVSGGFVQLPLTANAPPFAECNETSEHGQMKVDATNNRLWICTATGWKSTVLQ